MSARSDYENWYKLEVIPATPDRYGREPMGSSAVAYFSPGLTKVADIPVPIPSRTVLRRAKSSEAAKRLVSKLGKVLSCIRVKAEEVCEEQEHYEQRILKDNAAPVNIVLTKDSVSIDSALRVSVKRNRMNVQVR